MSPALEVPSDGRVCEVVDEEDEVTWPVERTDVFVSRTPTETWSSDETPTDPRHGELESTASRIASWLATARRF